MLSIEIKAAVFASVAVLTSSVLLACVCLYYRRCSKNKRRSTSNSVEKSKSNNADDVTPGNSNFACDETWEESNVYETCKETGLEPNDTYDYATIQKPNYQIQEIAPDPEDQAVDSTDDRVYAVLEGALEQVKSEPVYFTLENSSNQATEAECQTNETQEHLGRTEDEGTHRDTCVVNIQDEIYENVQRADLEGYVVSPGLHGISEDTNADVEDQLDGEAPTVVCGGGKDNAGYTDDERMHGDKHEQEDLVEVNYGDEDSPDEGIYENWETITKNEKHDITTKAELPSDGFYKTDLKVKLNEDSGFESTYENLKDFRNSLA